MSASRKPQRAGFTLIELLVVILIILLVSAATLPVIVPALTHRQVGEAARLLQAALAGSRDAAIRANEPRGIRLLTDPNFRGGLAAGGIYPAMAFNRFVPIEPGPSYNEGRVTVYLTSVSPNPGASDPPFALRVEEEQFTPGGLPNSRTSWFWNVRIGDKIRLGASGRLYTIVGPIWVNPWSGIPLGQNPDLFVNVGAPRDLNLDPNAPIQRTGAGGSFAPEYLLLVNGQDDNGNGYVDEGFDGFDNNFNGVRDLIDATEWEPEAWSGNQFTKQIPATGQTNVVNEQYVIIRRPVPSPGAREVTLPSDVVIDATTWNAVPPAQPERSRLPIDQYSGYCDIMLAPNGQVIQMGATSSDATPVTLPFFHFWLTEREDVVDGNGTSYPTVPYLLPMPQFPPAVNANDPVYPNPNDQTPRFLKGDRRLVTLFPKTGQILTTAIENFDPTNVNAPYVNAQQGFAEEIK